MYNKLQKAVTSKTKSSKKGMLKDIVRRMKKENIMDHGPLQKPSKLN